MKTEILIKLILRKDVVVISVLKSRRNESKAEYVRVAHEIVDETVRFVSRLSARYARIMSERVTNLAYEVSDHTSKANVVLPVDEERFKHRKENLITAKGALSALDTALTDVYCILMKNPEGAFSTRHGNPFSSSEAVERLEKMAEKLGGLIDDEERLIEAVMKNDKERFEKVVKIKNSINEKTIG